MADNTASASVQPVAAGTLVLVRDGAGGVETLMVVRRHEIDFARGAAVFPGGKVAAADRDAVLRHNDDLDAVDDLDGLAELPDPSAAAPTIIIDSNNASNDPTKAKVTTSASWLASTSNPGYYGTSYLYANTGPVSDAAEFAFNKPAAGPRIVDVWYTAGTNRSTTAPFIAFDAKGTKLASYSVNQTANGGKWVQLGTVNFWAGWNKVVLSRWTTAGKVVIADAVRIRDVAPPMPWTAIAALDQGIREDSYGLGSFRAPRSGYQHSGIDYLMPVGTALSSPWDSAYLGGYEARPSDSAAIRPATNAAPNPSAFIVAYSA